MKVVLKDKRRNPRIIFIDGRRYILPSNKEVIKDISKSAFSLLSKAPFLEVSEYIENPVIEPKIESKIEPKIEPKVEIKEDTKVEIPEPFVEPVVEPKVEEVYEPPVIEEVIPSEPEQIPEVEVKKNYASLTKRELRVIIEEKGGDTSGMTKSNMLDWLKDNP